MNTHILIHVGDADHDEETGSLRFIMVTIHPGPINLAEDAVLSMAECAVSAATGIDLDVIQRDCNMAATFSRPVWIVDVEGGGS